jgi:ADP-ribose pyrophosphatase
MRKLVPKHGLLIPDSAELAFKGVLFDTYQWQQELFDGSFTTFEMLRRHDIVSSICVIDDQVIILSEKQPPNIERMSLPGGSVDKTDVDILAAAKREVLEETGYSFKNWKIIKVTQPSTEIEWFVYLFVAWEMESKIEPHLDGGEDIELKLFSAKDAKQKVKSDAHLRHNQDIFNQIDSVDDLINHQEFEGKEVDR